MHPLLQDLVNDCRALVKDLHAYVNERRERERNKGDIAEQLAWRDAEIERLKTAAAESGASDLATSGQVGGLWPNGEHEMTIPDRTTRQALRLYEMATEILAIADVYTDATELAAEWLNSGPDDQHREAMRALLLQMARARG